jgi:hypothetical protein
VRRLLVMANVVPSSSNLVRVFYFASELYRLSGRRLLPNLVPTFAGGAVPRGQRNGSPWLLISIF